MFFIWLLCGVKIMIFENKKFNSIPTEEQISSTKELCESLKKDIPTIKKIKGHNEYKGYYWKNCPGFNMGLIRNNDNTNLS